jgi:FAD/FMN-containing dehydrogenase
MRTLRATNLAGTDIQLDSAAVTAFKGRLHGVLLCPEDPPYTQARKVWNGMIDKHPALIARCTGVADVLHTVHFARAHDLPIAMRCGSHNAAGHATCDGGIVADLTPMKGIRVDAAQRRVQAQGGVLWGEFDRETQVYGLGTTGGAVNDTGIAGLTLGGGIGWLMSRARSQGRHP